jgi:uncharacterized membrane protein required for colicin V production
MTSFDLLVILVLALSTWFAVIRGGLREVGTLVALAVAAGLALLLAKPVLSIFLAKPSFLYVAMLAAILGAGFFAGLYVLLHLALKRFKLKAKAQRLDKIGGGAFGFLRGLALVGLGFLAYDYYVGADHRSGGVKKALLLPVAEATADFFGGFAPSENKLTAPGVQQPATNAAVDGYPRGERSALSEIVTTVTTSDDTKAGPNDAIAGKIRETDPE